MNTRQNITNASREAKTSRTTIITGGNTGLGFATARSLLETPSRSPGVLVIASRDAQRAGTAVAELREIAARAGNATEIRSMSLDLSSLASVRSFASEVKAQIADRRLPPLHLLICNAGVQAADKMLFTKDGFEATFGVNHLGHFLLTTSLSGEIQSPGRILVVASGTHDPAQKTGMPAPAWNGPTALARGELGPLSAKDNPGVAARRRYTTSKLANVYFSYELAGRLPKGVTVAAFDPGLMPGTGLAREASPVVKWVWTNVLPRILPLMRLYMPNIHTTKESGASLARLATDPSLQDKTGKYFEGRKEISSSKESYDLERRAELWTISEQLVASRK